MHRSLGYAATGDGTLVSQFIQQIFIEWLHVPSIQSPEKRGRWHTLLPWREVRPHGPQATESTGRFPAAGSLWHLAETVKITTLLGLPPAIMGWLRGPESVQVRKLTRDVQFVTPTHQGRVMLHC